MADVLPDQIAKARDAGYSDAEIAAHLGQTDERFGAAAKAGYSPSEILQHVAPQPSGLWDNAVQGVADAVGGVGKTSEAYLGAGPTSTAMQQWAKENAPADFKATPLYDEKGFHPSGILPTIARGAPAVAGGLAAAAVAPEALGAAGAIGAGAGAGWLMGAGNSAQEAADRRTGVPNSPILKGDLVRGGLTQGAESVVQALPITRFLPGAAGALEKTGVGGVVSAGKELGKTTAVQAASSAAANAVHQVGESVGNTGGLRVNPTEVANAGLSGAVAAAPFAAKVALKSSLDSMKYSGISPDLQQDAVRFANRVQDHADGENLNGSFLSSRAAQKTGEEAYTKAKSAVTNELGAAVSDMRSRVTLPVDADNALKGAMSGKTPNARDYAMIESALGNDPQAGNVMSLLRQAHVADVVGDTGVHIGGKFTGGIGGAFKNILKGEHVMKTGLAAAGGAAFEGGAGHIIAYGPETLAAAAGAAVLARLTDNLTGAQAPAGRFVRNFADGATPTRVPVNQPPPAAPAAAPGPAPAGGPPMIAPGQRIIPPAIQAQMAAHANLAKLAQANAPPAPPPPQQFGGAPPIAPGQRIIPPAIQAQMATRAILEKQAAASAAARAPAPEAPPPSTAVPRDVLSSAKSVMAARAWADKLKAEAEAAQAPAEPEKGVDIPKLPKVLPADWLAKVRANSEAQSTAQSEVAKSPLIDQLVGGPDNVPTTAAAKVMRQQLGAAKALAQLRSDPAADAEASREEKAAAAAEKAHAKAEAAASKAKDQAEKAKAKADAAAEKQKAREATLATKTEKKVATAKAAAEAPKPPAQVTSVTKSDGNIGIKQDADEYVVPMSRYGHLEPVAAGNQAYADAVAAGQKVGSKPGFINSTVSNITTIRNKADAVAAEVPGLNPREIATQFEGVGSQKQAVAHREWLKQQMPAAAAALDKHFSDVAIKGSALRKGMWNRVGK